MQERIEFTREMKRDYTILMPNMLPVHFRLLRDVFRLHGYNMVLLDNEGPGVVEAGLKYVHNDTCYPALLCIGQFIDALESGKYDLNKTALIITQTGGGCRASNYIHLLRKALVTLSPMESDSLIFLICPMYSILSNPSVIRETIATSSSFPFLTPSRQDCATPFISEK